VTDSRTTLQKRRAMDFDSVQATLRHCSHFVEDWRGFSSTTNAEMGRATSSPQDVCIYEVNYRIRSPIGRDRYHDRWNVRFDLSSPNYPAEQPTLQVLSKERPWGPHVSPYGGVCLGSLWGPERTVAHLIIDMARVLNFDEDLAKLRKTKIHHNPDSISWWQERHAARAISQIHYPQVIVPAVLGTSAIDSVFGKI
jgi:ubiquitin-protein ligase